MPLVWCPRAGRLGGTVVYDGATARIAREDTTPRLCEPDATSHASRCRCRRPRTADDLSEQRPEGGGVDALPPNCVCSSCATAWASASIFTAAGADVGSAVTKLLDSDASKEVAVFGAVWIDGSPAQYVRKVKDIENFERGGAFRITKRIGDPPRLEDFAQLELPAEDIKDLRSCKVGDCELKLGATSLQQLRAEVHWGTPGEKAEAEAALPPASAGYVTEYRQGGNERLAVYRDADDPVFVANEFRSMIERAPALMAMPDLLRYLLEYPSATLERSSEFFYWQEARFGLKPTIRINHASHYFWTARGEECGLDTGAITTAARA